MYRQSEKNLLNIDAASTCPHNMVNFGLLTAEICWRVWDTPANFNGFRVLAALLHSTLVLGVSQTLRRWTEAGPLYSAGRPSRWALAHISSYFLFSFVCPFVLVLVLHRNAAFSWMISGMCTSLSLLLLKVKYFVCLYCCMGLKLSLFQMPTYVPYSQRGM